VLNVHITLQGGVTSLHRSRPKSHCLESFTLPCTAVLLPHAYAPNGIHFHFLQYLPDEKNRSYCALLKPSTRLVEESMRLECDDDINSEESERNSNPDVANERL
jgi:hypothetical protein